MRIFFLKNWEKKLLPILLIVPTFVVFFLVSIYPFIYSIYMTFLDWWLYKPGIRFIGFGNYVKFVLDEKVLNSLKNTFFFAGCAVGIEFIVGLALGLLFNRAMKGRRIFVSFLMIPMVMAPVAVGLMWRIMLNSVYGVFNYLLSFVGIASRTWLGNPTTALPVIIVVDIWQWSPFVMLVLLAGLQSLPKEPYEAAIVDGASKSQVLWYITLPLLRPVILVVLLIRIIDALKEFDKIYVMTQGGPGLASETISFRGFVTAFRFTHISYGATIGLVLNILIIIIAQFLIKLLAREI